MSPRKKAAPHPEPTEVFEVWDVGQSTPWKVETFGQPEYAVRVAEGYNEDEKVMAGIERRKVRAEYAVFKATTVRTKYEPPEEEV